MRVLLVEDDAGVAQSIELMLKVEEMYVYRTDLGEEGVDLGKSINYFIILLDLTLPDISGYDVLRSLRLAKVATPVLNLLALRASRSRDWALALMIIFPSLFTRTNLSLAFTRSSDVQKATPSRSSRSVT